MQFYILYVLLITNLCTYAQDWLRIYGQEHYWAAPFNIYEMYDKGYLICYNFQHTQSSFEEIGLLKTDINGNKLFDKHIGNSSSYSIHNGDINITVDGGVIVSGQIFSEDSSGDPFILKLDACYNSEWCKIYHTPNLYDWAGSVQYVPWDSTFVFIVFNHYYDLSDKRISLFKVDGSGNLIWSNTYCTNNSYRNETPMGVCISEYDSTFLLYGHVFLNDTVNFYSEPYWSKIDNNGDFLWERFIMPDTSYIGGLACDQPLFHDNGNLSVPAISAYDPYTRLFNLDKDGNYLGRNIFYKADTVNNIDITCSNQMSSGNFIFGVQNICDNTGFYTVQVTDSSGNLINERVPPYDAYVYDIIGTSDDKILLSCQHDYDLQDFMIIKYNSQLQYDSIYSQQLIYDSLCQGSITSGNIDFSCDVITKIADRISQGKENLTISPNPCEDYFIIHLPETTLLKESHNGQEVTRLLKNDAHNLKLNIYDSNGKLIYNKSWPEGLKEQVINTTSWKHGIYFIRIIGGSEVVSTGKFIVR